MMANQPFPQTIETAWARLMKQLSIDNVNTLKAQKNALRQVHRLWGIR